MNAWESIISQIRNGDYAGAATSYSYAMGIKYAEAMEVVKESVEKIRRDRKVEPNEKNIPDPPQG